MDMGGGMKIGWGSLFDEGRRGKESGKERVLGLCGMVGKKKGEGGMKRSVVFL